MAHAKIHTDLLDSIIVGRVEPHIYAFTTQTIPNYLKIGDTHRPLHERLSEWKRVFPNLHHIYTHSARIDDDTIFRDLSIHQYLENEKHLHRLRKKDVKLQYYSNEFFKDATTDDIDEAIADTHKSARDKDGRYPLYSSDHLPKVFTYTRGKSLTPRENQQAVINNFKTAYRLGRKNLLMFAVMRFGKSFTSMCCAKEMGADLVLVVSAKTDVTDEWKKTVESIGNFEGYIFADKSNLSSSMTFIRNARKEGNKVVLFLTLQDLQGDEMKDAHREVFDLTWDLLLVDETHFGARAEHYGQVLLNKKEAAAETKRQMEGVDTLDNLDKAVKELRRRITIHLSGTPYRILMGSEFEKEDIIAFVQFSDIAHAQQQWNEEHKFDEETPEWDNPYFGFPQMIRFAFRPNQSSIERLAILREKGATTSFSELFKPQSLSATTSGFNRFVHEDVVLDFLKVIDGTKNDTNVLGFLDNELIKKGKLCRHMVIVLPYCASCDAMEKLIKSNSVVFRNLSEYEILNISGVKRAKRFHKTSDIKRYIAKCEVEGKRTITLTVNRMLTGNTVPQWDTMLFLKQSSSPEEYDQAIFRLQNPYIDEYEEKGHIIKYNMKPQTILVDFDPERVFRLQERKSQIYNVNTEHNGNSKLRERIETELRISPIITLDHDKLRKATATDVIEAVLNYAKTRSVLEEASDMPIDMSLLNNPELRQVIDSLNEIDSKKGFIIPAYRKAKDEEGDDVAPHISPAPPSGNSKPAPANDKTSCDNSIAKKFASYCALILFFAFLTEDKVLSLEEIIRVIGASDNNIRLGRHLGLSAGILNIIQSNSNGFALSKLDYKIEKLNSLNFDNQKEPLERVKVALTKFGRMSESEIVTPGHVADEMVRLLPDTVFSKGPVLDIASKQGEFTIALLRRYGSSVSDKIYSVCTSPLAYEFTRKVYKMLSLPIGHIFDSFTSYDLIKRDKDNQFIIPKEITAMNFSAIIGNPPYQLNDGSGASNDAANPIYHFFVQVGKIIHTSILSLIMPSKWMIGGKAVLKPFRQEMMEDNHIVQLVDYQDSGHCFKRQNIDGGICYFLRDTIQTSKVKYTYVTADGKHITTRRKLNASQTDIVIRDIRRQSIILKASHNCNLFKEIVSLTQPFGIRKDLFNSPERYPLANLSDSYFNGSVKIFGVKGIKGGAKRTSGYITSDTVNKNQDAIPKYKLFFTTSYSTNAINPPQVIVGNPNEVCTETFLLIGPFNTQAEQLNCKKFFDTTFFKILLFFGRGTMQVSKDVFRFVPLQDFTEGSDIDWSRSVAEIDAQLYAKYGLTDEEIAFIESMIKPM